MELSKSERETLERMQKEFDEFVGHQDEDN
jgi:hypothetical protein